MFSRKLFECYWISCNVHESFWGCKASNNQRAGADSCDPNLFTAAAGNTKFKKAFQTLLGTSLRVVHNGDPIPNFPVWRCATPEALV